MNIKMSSINAAWLTNRVRCGALWKAIKAVSELAAIHLPFAVKRDSTLGFLWANYLYLIWKTLDIILSNSRYKLFLSRPRCVVY